MKILPPDFAVCRAKYEEKREQFERFRALLLLHNARYNLTAITEEEEVFHKHFLDSLAGEHLFPQGANCCEVGSGAGFPSIPLKIVREDLQMTLVESTGKKCEFLRTVVRELELKNVQVVCARAEDVGRDIKFRESFDVCFARAVARLSTLAEYCMPLVKKGGVFLAYKGEAQEELSEAKKALSVLGDGQASAVSYELPEGYGARTLVCVKKTRSTPEKYPRGQGKERSDPL